MDVRISIPVVQVAICARVHRAGIAEVIAVEADSTTLFKWCQHNFYAGWGGEARGVRTRVVKGEVNRKLKRGVPSPRDVSERSAHRLYRVRGWKLADGLTKRTGAQGWFDQHVAE